MALSNLIWWPWFGKGAEEPVVGAELPMGGRDGFPQGAPPPTTPVMYRFGGDDEEDEIEFVLYLLTVT